MVFKVLIVNDDPKLRLSLEYLMRREGRVTDIAKGLALGVNACMTKPFAT